MNTEDKRVIAHAAFSYGFLLGTRTGEVPVRDLAAKIRHYVDEHHPRIKAILEAMDRNPDVKIGRPNVGLAFQQCG